MAGATAVYTLTNNKGDVLISDNEVTGYTALNANYNVNISKGSEYGYILGGGVYSVGSFAQVEAVPMYGGEFLGWYEGEELVSSEEIYRFAVKDDTELVAMFSDVNLYEVNFVSQEGGWVENVPLNIAEGVKIYLEAEPMMGYEFDCWSTDGNGLFEDARDNTTTYIMGDKNTTISACFKKIEEKEEIIDVLQPSEQENDIQNEDVLDITDYVKDNDNNHIVDPNTGYKNVIKISFAYMLFSIVSILFFSKKREKCARNEK